MFRATADCEADSRRFIERVVASEVVWHLTVNGRVAHCESNASADETDDSTESAEPPIVLLFFSDEAYAKRARKAHFPDYATVPIDLFDFLYRWLPGMTDDGVLAGPNWTGDLVGLEFEPYPLRESIASAMTEAHRARYEARYRRLTDSIG